MVGEKYQYTERKIGGGREMWGGGEKYGQVEKYGWVERNTGGWNEIWVGR